MANLISALAARPKALAAGMVFSATFLVGVVVNEGWVDHAIIPVKKDPPTGPYGITRYPDGSPVKLGDKFEPVTAMAIIYNHAKKDEAALRASLQNVEISQDEFDVAGDYIIQFGLQAWKASSMLRWYRAGEPQKACAAYLRYKYAGSFDCSTPGNKICAGVWTRQQDRAAVCRGEMTYDELIRKHGAFKVRAK
jgi:GH24 family phage-related lysozyme (muramidase)